MSVAALAALAGCAQMRGKNTWAERTRTDLEGARAILEKDAMGPIDAENAAFRQWLDEGLKHSLERAESVDSENGYYFTMKYFVNGFHDPHMNFSAHTTDNTMRWPGFVTAWRGGKVVVHASAGDASHPPVGAALVSCDGKTPEQLLRENGFTYSFRENVIADRYMAVARMFVDSGNPFVRWPASCRFEVAGQRPDFKLTWVATTDAELGPKVQAATFGAPPKAGIRRFGAKATWISFPTFYPVGAAIEATKKQIAQLARHRGDRVVVIDLRGNSGGGSEWGDEIAEQLFGRATYEKMRAAVLAGGVSDEWRVSEDNVKQLRDVYLPMILLRSGQSSVMYRNFLLTEHEMESALARHIPSVRGPMGDDPGIKHQGRAKPARVRAKVFLLTDGRCFSSCLTFVDLMLANPEVIHVGLPTGADTFYEDTIRFPLPSGARLLFTMDAIRNRKRGRNEACVPKHEWTGEISDTPALERWVLGLTKEP